MASRRLRLRLLMLAFGVVFIAVFIATLLLVLHRLAQPHPTPDYLFATALAFLTSVLAICASLAFLTYRSGRR